MGLLLFFFSSHTGKPKRKLKPTLFILYGLSCFRYNLVSSMKKISSEFGHNYKSYSFGYANYCLREREDLLSEIYASGHLPYSGSSNVKNVFYMARSARVPLAVFRYTSENRRVAGKFKGKFLRESIPIENFNVKDKKFLSFCLEYFAKMHGSSVMPKKRLNYILESGPVTHIVKYTEDDKPKAYVFEVSDNKTTHFWFSFYDLDYIHRSLGMWLMLDSAENAKKRGADFFYVGTVYGEKALYKTAFNGLEHWDGEKWVGDIKKLKSFSRTDNQRSVDLIDVWKQNLELF